MTRAEIEAILAGIGPNGHGQETHAGILTSDIRALCTALIESMDRVEELEAKLEKANRWGTDQQYMRNAYHQMLGPTGLLVAQMWATKGVTRTHTSWGPEAHKLSGEERAQTLLDVEAAPKQEVEFIDDEPVTARKSLGGSNER
jgi:ABC-type branched-subunit amino acid transport system ATPase component